MINYSNHLSYSVSKEKAREAVLDFLPEKVEKVISLPAESFMFEAKVKVKHPTAEIYGYEKKQSVYRGNIRHKYTLVKHFLNNYYNSDIFKSELVDIDFAWLDLCATPSVEIQAAFVTMARKAKPKSRVVITLTRRIRYMKEENKPFATIERFVNLIHYLTNGKVVKQYDYINGRSPMTMLFVQF